MRAYPIDASRATLRSTGIVTPVPKWVEMADGKKRPDPQGRQETDENGAGLWRVEAVIPADEADDRDRTETVQVLMAAHDRPEPGPFGTPLSFTGLVMAPGYVKRATGELTPARWSADGLQSATSSRRPSPSSSES